MACLATQHSNWPCSPMLLATETQDRKTVMALALNLDQWMMSDSQSRSRLARSLSWTTAGLEEFLTI